MKFLYGYDLNNYIDITTDVILKCFDSNCIKIPAGEDNICTLIGYDPYPNFLKYIMFVKNDGSCIFIDHNTNLYISFESLPSDFLEIAKLRDPKIWWETKGNFLTDTDAKLSEIHKRLNFSFGSFKEEYPEQRMAMNYLNENSKVLEIGGNTGRNTCIINVLLKDPKNLVTLESDPNIALQLIHNLKQNGFTSNVEASALSERRLIQRGWNTIPIAKDEAVPEGWTEINSIGFDALVKKYGVEFDTLVADCEGALYYIFMDNANILNNINLIIMENDYTDITHKYYVDSVLKEKGFKRVYHEGNGWGPCSDFFFEVWQK